MILVFFFKRVHRLKYENKSNIHYFLQIIAAKSVLESMLLSLLFFLYFSQFQVNLKTNLIAHHFSSLYD